MLFNSYIFVFAFLPICLAGFYILKRFGSDRAVKIWLIAFSLWFYGYFNLYYLLIMICSVLFNYGFYSGIRASSNRKRIFVTGIIFNLAVLFYFKYYDFFIENINTVFHSGFALKNILLPLGISFFTFQQISFLHDAYDGSVDKVGFVEYALFITFFPQLIAGPIVTAQEMLPQFTGLKDKKFDAEIFSGGVFVFVMGLAKKVLIADVLGRAVDYGYDKISSLQGTEALIVILLYSLQLYFDFSGYCDMAIGIGRMFGLEIALNFNSPYKAVDIIDFWKRWHITLSRFFTRNIYIPLGGNRCGNARMYTNLFIVFFLSGLWHGAGWNFVLWGCMHGVLYILTRAYRKKYPPGLHVLGMILTFAFVNVAWVFFRSSDISEAIRLLSVAFSGTYGLPDGLCQVFNEGEFWYVLKILHLTAVPIGKYIVMTGYILVCTLMVFFAPNVHELQRKMKFGPIHAIITGVVFLWCVVSFSGVGTFLYFNF